MDSIKNQTESSQISNQLIYVQSMLSWKNVFQTLDSEPQNLVSKNNHNGRSSHEFNLTDFHSNLKNIETDVFSKEQLSVINSQNSHLLSSNHQILGQESKKQSKSQIKTFPNFIFRTFSNYLFKYEHLYSDKDGLAKIKKYLNTHYGAKHYTLQQLSCLFNESSLWNTKLNRVVLHRMLDEFSYCDIFSNSQRKKKKRYLIMTKVFKLRCRNSHLSSRVQAE